MANTVVMNASQTVITISAIDSDWLITDTLSKRHLGGTRVHSIQFNPAAAADKCKVLDGSASGSQLFYALCADNTDQRIKYFPEAEILPFLDFSEGTYTAGSSVVVTLYPQKF